MDLGKKDETVNLASTDSEAHRHYCECLSVVRMYRETLKSKGEYEAKKRIQSFLLQVEKHRGSDCSNRLREDALNLLKGASNGKDKT